MEIRKWIRIGIPVVCLYLALLWGLQIQPPAVEAASGVQRSVLVPGGVILYVDADASGANIGTSWSNAYTSLQPALEQAQAGDQIWVAAGTYKPSVQVGGTGDRYQAFQMKNGVAIYGGFAGGEGSLEQRDWENQLAILSGDIGVEGVSSDNCYHVIHNSADLGLNASAILDGFIITQGITGGNGGGMYNVEASPTLANCLFTANSASYGGGMSNNASSPTLINCQFIHNLAGTSGGGMYNDVSAPILTDCAFIENSAPSHSGGGMRNIDGSAPVLTNCSFENNSADYGGGMSNNHSAPVIKESIFAKNTASHGGGMDNYYSSPSLSGSMFYQNTGHYGAGMYNMNSSPILLRTNFVENTAWNEGGGMRNYASSPVLTQCTFLGNISDYHGGALYNKTNSAPVLVNCSLLDNTSGFNGGGMHNYEASPTLINCTISGNHADYYGGGMYIDRSSSPLLTNCIISGNSADWGAGIYINDNSTPRLTNCILWGDTPDEIFTSSSTAVITYSDVQGGYVGVGNLNVDPGWVDPANANFHLSPGSPCMEVGNNAAPELPTHDFEGHPRVIDGDEDGTATVDLGVDEFTPPGFFVYTYLPLILGGD